MEEKAILKIKEWFIKHFEDYDKLDFSAELDRSLSVSENKELFKQKFAPFYKKNIKDLIEKAQLEEEKEKLQKINLARNEELKAIEEFKKIDLSGKVTFRKFEIIQQLLKCLSFYHSVIIEGEAGLGKTYSILDYFNKEYKEENYTYLSGYVTPLSFYKFLWENKEKTIIIDDVVGIHNQKVMSLLKSVLFSTNGKRSVSYLTTFKEAQELPSTFIFEGKIIYLTNKFPSGYDEDAVKSRAFFYNLNFSFPEIKALLFEMLESKEKDYNIVLKVKQIINDCAGISLKDFNFRMLDKLIGMCKIFDFATAKSLFCEISQIDDDLQLIYDLKEAGLSVEEQFFEFKIKTGLSRATFFRIKKKLECKMGIYPSLKVSRKSNETFETLNKKINGE